MKSDPSAESKWPEFHQRLKAVRDRIEEGFVATGEAEQRSLRERARALAREPEKETARDILELVVFTLATERYAVEQAFVDEVFGLEEVTIVPGAPDFVAGIVNLRGTMLTLVNIKKFFGLPESGITDIHKVITIRNKNMKVGLLADTLQGASSVAQSLLQPSLPTLTGIRADYLKGIGPASLVVLDIQKFLSDHRLLIDQTVAGIPK